MNGSQTPPGALLDLRSRRAIVTGGAAGIGAAISRALAAAGARVAVADLNAEAAGELAREIGGGAQGLAVDVRKRQSVEACFHAAEEAFGGYDILCANAGVSTMRRVADLTDEDWDFNFAVNARGVFLCNQTAVRHFLERKAKGVIVNTASLAAKAGAPWLAHYSASKFAVMGFTQGAGTRGGRRRHSRQLRVSGVRAHRHAVARDRVGGGLARHDTRSGDRRIHRADAARPDRGAGRRGERRSLPRLRSRRASSPAKRST